jgi:pimeloyl-ACP methyl ester carboxylesterase
VRTTFPVRRHRLLALVPLVAIFGVAVLVASSSSAHARARAVSPAATVKPTVVLVHGAWADGSSWDGVITRLQRDGYTVLAPADPLRSLTGDSAYIASFLKSIKGPIVLVGHSYGGAVISDAATGDSNVKALVYIDAFVPAQGESVLKLASKYPGSKLPPAITEVTYSEGGGQTGEDVYVKTASFRSVFAADVPARTADLMAVTQRPIALTALSQQSGPPAWKSIPSWYLVGRNDEVIPPATQLFMAHRAHSHVVEINSSHASLVSHPAAVASLILAAIHHIN